MIVFSRSEKFDMTERDRDWDLRLSAWEAEPLTIALHKPSEAMLPIATCFSHGAPILRKGVRKLWVPPALEVTTFIYKPENLSTSCSAGITLKCSITSTFEGSGPNVKSCGVVKVPIKVTRFKVYLLRALGPVLVELDITQVYRISNL